MDTIAENPAVYTDAMIDTGILLAEMLIDEVTGTTWEYKTKTITVDGDGTTELNTGTLFVRTITSATVDGVAETVTGWVGSDLGYIERGTGVFTVPTSTTLGRNVTVTFTAGATATAPADIAWCARTLAREHCLRERSRTPTNALQTVTDMGTFTHVQAGGPFNNPTSNPEVNQILRRRCHKIPGIG